ncbi:hypothetical protein M231_06012 [Tremella mesenterica]|uniref:Kinetochore protein Sos7 coiled-coil domain-containing protein n=1 Tax=Tremella mesenterica TaxID=5217 RepID=A0A4Q1BGL0_TREME|nr:hypothetical protein M231_06012 [Tremella mesenterica]
MLTYRLIASSSNPLHLEKYRDQFHERALRDVTGHGNDSALVLDPSNPLLVKAEMEAQKDYFRRLKFTYLEQEAKRNFLFSITGDEPQVVPPGENEEREIINAQKKAALKALKEEIATMQQEAVQLARMNAQRQLNLSNTMTEVQKEQKQIKEMELELQRIRTTYPPDHRLTSSQAEKVLDEQVVEIQRLTEEISTTVVETDKAREEVTRLAKEVQRLGPQRDREEARAKEVREGREAGDTKVDEVCRSLSASIVTYRGIMGIREIKAPSDRELQLTYDVPSKDPITLIIEFDQSKRLAGARLLGSDIDIGESVDHCVSSNDVPGLIADVLIRIRSPL